MEEFCGAGPAAPIRGDVEEPKQVPAVTVRVGGTRRAFRSAPQPQGYGGPAAEGHRCPRAAQELPGVAVTSTSSRTVWGLRWQTQPTVTF